MAVALVLGALAAWAVAPAPGPAVADARGHVLGAGPSLSSYPWPRERDPEAEDQWGFTVRQCTSYVAWYLNSHGVPFTTRTRGPAGLGHFRSAGEWDRGAAAAGFPVSAQPVVGSIAQWRGRERSPASPGAADDQRYLPYRDALGFVAGPPGHVAVVTDVLPDGSVLVAQYDGIDRSLGLLHTRAPRYLYIGVGVSPRAAALPIAALPPPAPSVGATPARMCS